MPRAHLRYFFFTLAVAAVAAAFAARAVVHGQDAGAFRSFLPASILPAIDRGVVADWSHAPGHARRRSSANRCGTRSSRSTASAVRRALHRRPRHREVPRRHVRVVAHGRARPRHVHRVADRDGVRTTIICEFRRRPHRSGRGSGGGGRGAAAAPRRRVRAARVPRAHGRSCRTISTTRSCSGTCRSSTSSAPGTSSRPPARPSPSPCSTRACRTRTRPCGFTRTRFAMTTASCIRRSATSRSTSCSRPSWGPPSRFVAPHDFIWNDNAPLDLDGHGTHVSGTIGQLTNNGVGMAGVAFNVKIMPVKVIDSDWDDIFGSPNQGTDDVVARGIRYAADNGANVINMSIGRTGPIRRRSIEDAIKYAVGKGVFIADRRAATRSRTATRRKSSPRSRRACRARCRWRPSIPTRRTRTTRPRAATSSSSAPGGTDRGFGRNGYVWQQTYDFTLDRHVPAAAGGVHGAALRRARLHRLRRHVAWRRRTCRASRRC